MVPGALACEEALLNIGVPTICEKNPIPLIKINKIAKMNNLRGNIEANRCLKRKLELANDVESNPGPRRSEDKSRKRQR